MKVSKLKFDLNINLLLRRHNLPALISLLICETGHLKPTFSVKGNSLGFFQMKSCWPDQFALV